MLMVQVVVLRPSAEREAHRRTPHQRTAFIGVEDEPDALVIKLFIAE